MISATPYPVLTDYYPKAKTLSVSFITHLYYVKYELFVIQRITSRTQPGCNNFPHPRPKIISKLILVIRFIFSFLHVAKLKQSNNTDFGGALASCGNPHPPIVSNQHFEKIHSHPSKKIRPTTGFEANGKRLLHTIQHHHQTAISQIFEAPPHPVCSGLRKPLFGFRCLLHHQWPGVHVLPTNWPSLQQFRQFQN